VGQAETTDNQDVTSRGGVSGERLPVELANLSVPIVVPRVEIRFLSGESEIWRIVEGALAQAAALKESEGAQPEGPQEAESELAEGNH
jgi:hypothetical protein